MYATNLSAAEEFHLFGSLCASTIEELLEIEELNVAGAAIDLKEARGCFAAEDCLEPVLKLMRNLVGNLKKSDTKSALQFILANAEDLQMSMSREAEYGREKIDQALEVLNGTYN